MELGTEAQEDDVVAEVIDVIVDVVVHVDNDRAEDEV